MPVQERDCPSCGAALNFAGECLACLLRVGLGGAHLPASPAEVPTNFGPFEIACREDGSPWELGRGAMGVTYRATDQVLHRTVALKVIETSEASAKSPAVRERFLREARTNASLRHPNVAEIFQFGASPESAHAYYAMELIDGETLEQRVRRDGPLSAGDALEMAAQVASALAAAADQGLVHRDLKPGNIMLSRAQSPAAVQATVIDFGLAKAMADAENGANLTHDGFVGTPAFASPEQFGSEPADARSDIYSLGVTLWYALTGRVPFAGKTLDDIQQHPARHALPVAELTARNIPVPLIALLRRMLAVEPASRPASARELLAGLEACRSRVGDRRRERARWTLGAMILAFVALAVAVWRLHLPAPPPPRPAAPAPEKSIAVLPFANLSSNQDNAFFTDGVQNEILTDLAKVADLKVISRTSVMRYKVAGNRNSREIGQELAVAHLVEGSVQRDGDRVRVSAELIDAHTDTQLWAENYDRPLNDVFAIQTQIATAIADQLQAHLSPPEKKAMKTRPTANIDAYEQYLRGLDILERYPDLDDQRTAKHRALDLLQDATRRDPGFVEAWGAAGRAHALVYGEDDPTPAPRDQAVAAVNTALRLRPNSGEAHLARAQVCFMCGLGDDAGDAELALARPSLPNSAEFFVTSGLRERILGRWDLSTRDFEKARDLDPRDAMALDLLGDHYVHLRRFADAERVFGQRARNGVDPRYVAVNVAAIHFAATGETDKLAAALHDLPAYIDPGAGATPMRVLVALSNSDYPAAYAALAAAPLHEFMDVDWEFYYPPAWYEAQIARAAGDAARMKTALAKARQYFEAQPAPPDQSPRVLAVLAQIDAGLGDKEAALRKARRAVELVPISADAEDGPLILQCLAQVYVWTGDHARALDTIETLLSVPGYLSYGYLRKDPMWSPLRGDPRFGKMVASQAPK